MIFLGDTVGLWSQIPPGCACAPACVPAPVGSRANFFQDVPLHVPLHVPLAPWAPEPNSSRMCPFIPSCFPAMCPWLRGLRSQIPPGCAPSCAPACAPGPVGSGARFLHDVPFHVPLHVPLTLLAPGQNPSRMCPFMCPFRCPWLRWLRSQISPGCFLSCAPVCAPGCAGSGAKSLQDVPLHVPLAPLAPEPNSSGMLPFMCPCLCL